MVNSNNIKKSQIHLRLNAIVFQRISSAPPSSSSLKRASFDTCVGFSSLKNRIHDSLSNFWLVFLLEEWPRHGVLWLQSKSAWKAWFDGCNKDGLFYSVRFWRNPQYHLLPVAQGVDRPSIPRMPPNLHWDCNVRKRRLQLSTGDLRAFHTRSHLSVRGGEVLNHLRHDMLLPDPCFYAPCAHARRHDQLSREHARCFLVCDSLLVLFTKDYSTEDRIDEGSIRTGYFCQKCSWRSTGRNNFIQRLQLLIGDSQADWKAFPGCAREVRLITWLSNDLQWKV